MRSKIDGKSCSGEVKICKNRRFLHCFWRRQGWAIFGTKSASKCSILEAQKWPSWIHFHALGRLRAICWRSWEGPRWAQNLIKNGSKTVCRGEEKVTKTIVFYTLLAPRRGSKTLQSRSREASNRVPRASILQHILLKIRKV